MKRRNVILGLGSASLGGSAVLGSGAFSRVLSHRNVTIQVAEDENAYLGLEGCPDSANSSYTTTTDSGHFAIDMSAENQTDAGGEGVNSNSISRFDDVFQITNQGKEAICVWIEDKAGGDPQRVTFYEERPDQTPIATPPGDDPPDESIEGLDNAIHLDVGESTCVGLETYTKADDEFEETMPEAGDVLLDDITIYADVGVDCKPDDEDDEEDETVEGASISNVTFFTPDGQDPPDEDDLHVEVEAVESDEDDDPDPIEIDWEVDTPGETDIDEVVVFTGNNSGWYLDIPHDEDDGEILATEEEADEVYEEGDFPFLFESDTDDPDEGDEADKRCPESPGFDGEVGLKFDEYDADAGEWGETDTTNEECSGEGSRSQ